VRIQVAISVLNRHGLIAGATGTGKTKMAHDTTGNPASLQLP
jgi:MoxR-like ATPase